MAAYLIRRLWQMIPTLVGVVLLVFVLFKFFGGDPAEILGGLNATPEQIQALRRDLEICVFDERGVGNGFLLPAGPLREPWPRHADWVLAPAGSERAELIGLVQVSRSLARRARRAAAHPARPRAGRRLPPLI